MTLTITAFPLLIRYEDIEETVNGIEVAVKEILPKLARSRGKNPLSFDCQKPTKHC